MCARPNETHTAEGLQERRGAAARRPEEQRHRARLELDALGPGGQDGLPPLAPLANARRPPLGWSEPPLRLLSLEVPRREGSIPLIPDPPPGGGGVTFHSQKTANSFQKPVAYSGHSGHSAKNGPPKKVFWAKFSKKSPKAPGGPISSHVPYFHVIMRNLEMNWVLRSGVWQNYLGGGAAE